MGTGETPLARTATAKMISSHVVILSMGALGVTRLQTTQRSPQLKIKRASPERVKNGRPPSRTTKRQPATSSSLCKTAGLALRRPCQCNSIGTESLDTSVGGILQSSGVGAWLGLSISCQRCSNASIGGRLAWLRWKSTRYTGSCWSIT